MKILGLFLVLSLAAFAQEEEESEALKAMRLSCEKQKVALGCYNYANMLLRIEKSDQADKYFEMGCKLSHSPSCQKEKWDLPSATPSKSPAPQAAPAEKPETEPELAPETEPEAAPESTESIPESEETLSE